MVDESDNNSNGGERTGHRNGGDNTKVAKSGRQSKRRRSLFSALFQSSKSSNHSSDAKDGKGYPATMLGKNFDTEDFVLIKPKEAKCIEANIVGLVEEANDDDLLIGSIRSVSKTSNADPLSVADTDSYILSLNDQLELQKSLNRRSIRLKDQNCSSDSLFKAKQLTSTRESSPEQLQNTTTTTTLIDNIQVLSVSREQSPFVGGEWHSNANYIPIEPNHQQPMPRPDRHQQQHRCRQRSPILEKFIDQYKINLHSTSSSEDLSSCDSLSCKEQFRFTSDDGKKPIDNSTKEQLSKPITLIDDLHDPEQRLNYWRNLATRSASLWQSSRPINSERLIFGTKATTRGKLSSNGPTSDSEDDDVGGLELIGCSGSSVPVCYCSDDTSCSSVELVWSRPRPSSINRPTPQQFITINYKQFKQAMDLESSLKSASPIAKLPTTGAGANDGLDFARRAQKPAIFELAKPSRARDRRIGDRRRDHHRRRMASVEPMVASVDQGIASSWVANPLFGQIKSPDTDVERVSSNEQSLDRKSKNYAASVVKRPPNIYPKQMEKAEATWTNNEKFEELTRRIEQTIEANENSDEFSESLADSSATSDRLDKKHRWSLRVRSPFNGVRQETNAYLSHLINLDKRIKSNVSSFKSQLSEKISDTGKRASVLADQLITSIKDTTKEQLAPLGDKSLGGGLYDTLPNSFATNGSKSTDGSLNPDVDFVSNTTNSKKAQLFSLIYKHQLHANGQQVITSQPKPISRIKIIPQVINNNNNESADNNNSASTAEAASQSFDKQAEAPIAQSEQFADDDNQLANDFALAEQAAKQPSVEPANPRAECSWSSDTISPRKAMDASTIVAGDIANKRRRRCLRRKERRQMNVAPDSEDELMVNDNTVAGHQSNKRRRSYRMVKSKSIKNNVTY